MSPRSTVLPGERALLVDLALGDGRRRARSSGCRPGRSWRARSATADGVQPVKSISVTVAAPRLTQMSTVPPLASLAPLRRLLARDEAHAELVGVVVVRLHREAVGLRSCGGGGGLRQADDRGHGDASMSSKNECQTTTPATAAITRKATRAIQGHGERLRRRARRPPGAAPCRRRRPRPRPPPRAARASCPRCRPRTAARWCARATGRRRRPAAARRCAPRRGRR